LEKDLGGFESHVFRAQRNGQHQILRVTHRAHRSMGQLAGELEWMQWLYDHGASVCKPLMVIEDKRCLAVGPFILSTMEVARGRLIIESDWTPSFFANWGRHIGTLHKASQGYKPSRKSFKRPEWYEDNNIRFDEIIPEDQPGVRSVCEETLGELSALPQTPDLYGLIHCDPHPGNFYKDGETLTYFDFDDCCYQWFAYDIATILFGAVGQPWLDKNESARLDEAKRFLPAFLQGYQEITPLPDMVVENLPLFLKLRELSLYALSFVHASESFHGSSFDNDFMKNRKERIEHRIPYLMDDYTHLL